MEGYGNMERCLLREQRATVLLKINNVAASDRGDATGGEDGRLDSHRVGGSDGACRGWEGEMGFHD